MWLFRERVLWQYDFSSLSTLKYKSDIVRPTMS